MSDVSNYVKLGTSLAGIILAIVVIGTIFASEQMESVVSAIWAIVILGIFMALFQYKADRPAAKKK